MAPTAARARLLGRSHWTGYGHLGSEDPTQSVNETADGLVKSRVQFYETPVQQPFSSSPPPQIPLPPPTPPPQKKKQTQREVSNDEARALVQHARSKAARIVREQTPPPTKDDTEAETRQDIESGKESQAVGGDDQYEFPKDIQDSLCNFQEDALKQQKSLLRPATPEVKTAQLHQNRRVAQLLERIPMKRSLSDIASKKQYRSTLLMASAATRNGVSKVKPGDRALPQPQKEEKPQQSSPETAVALPTGSPEKDVPVALKLGSLGAVRLKQGRLREARQALGDALSLKRKLAPGSMVADLLNNLGNCSNLQGRVEESLDLYVQALKNLKENNGPKSEQCNALFNIGRAELQLQQFDAAISVLSEAWRSSREVFGEYHPYVAQCLDLLGFVQFSTGEFKAAMVSFKGALQVYRRLFGEDHEEVANSMCNVGLVREIKGDYENAWNAYSKGADIYERIGLPPSNPGVQGAKQSVQRMEVVLKQKASGKTSGDVNKRGRGSSKLVMEVNDTITRKMIRKKHQLG